MMIKTTTLFALLLGLCASASAATTLEDANRETRQWVQQTMQEQHIPGVQLAIIKDGKVVLSETYGLANVENQVAATPATRFPINSATKSFTGVAIMQLAEAGLVDLDAPVSRYLDDLPSAWRTIRVRQLLGHTSGLPDIIDQHGTEAETWKAVKAQPLVAPAGERFAYNQTNYGLLSQIITKQSKLPYERFIAERQFQPVGMPLSTFGDSYDLVPNAATIYARTPRGTLAPDDNNRLSHWYYDMPYSLWAGGGMQTTASEVARWLIALSEGRLIQPASLRRMWTVEKLNNGSDGEWAAGWPVLQTTPELRVAGIGGARAAFIVYPEQKLAIVMLTNLAGANPQRFIPKIADFYRPIK
ncbi:MULTISPECIES: serine hydrolase [unclassified Duganella]|uniref:serine hydrolase domain-containing protein n=1 Tax=unclassified Duganella TaxID=2636909 RepID=UPI00088D7228|nr:MULTISPECIES: serine hydrolase domain-containing protein [unclassified Duganella]SDF96529.1 CubicO group peptidase, beta-lactamase class C family [Duganella sp. OV458]SDJ08284.1 CubicO group peptidase, beta-lactamase class C family [Duganella sp. OV510]